MKPNQVSETALYGIPIVCLVLDGQERLCLAQISNTLLKNYSYNEIHNRRVALGITCVQCTPVQLEILRRAGAMPISSRRCGMITKREAERLCKSFIGAHNPPKLPENFAFDVSHECTWGSRGNFIPARYNSSRAKCIKCSFCNMYFSPNKFIFHSHRTSESKYTQPDAANFNSWRRHLKLTDKGSPDDLAHAWEDVKAMTAPTTLSPCSGLLQTACPYRPSPTPNHNTRPSHSTRPSPNSHRRSCAPDRVSRTHPSRVTEIATPQRTVERCSSTQSTRNEDDKSGDEARSMDGKMPVLPRKISYVSAFRPVIKDAESIAKLYGNRGKYNRARAGYLSPDFLSESSSYRSLSPGSVESVCETDVDVETNKSQEDEESLPHSIEDCRSPSVPVLSLSRGAGSPNGLESIPESEQAAVVESQRMNLPIQVVLSSNRDRQGIQLPVCNKTTIKGRSNTLSNRRMCSQCHRVCSPDRSSPYAFGSATNYQTDNVKSKDDCASREEPSSTVKEVETKSYKGQSREEGPREALNEGTNFQTRINILFLTRCFVPFLQTNCRNNSWSKKKLEREFQHLKDNFNHQMKRELSYREEMVQQLHIVRGENIPNIHTEPYWYKRLAAYNFVSKVGPLNNINKC
ncbi:unnamed protein product [Oncorhynchus mykiss]|uniref:c-SKI SMAD4-binding domain-containing protein n=1 Tax=Oncorhynchus mykiss TaxID=8022 RepID=A0A060YH28_ONCMY|nr:unnamed protein product [Oncorhynchus mykiss]